MKRLSILFVMAAGLILGCRSGGVERIMAPTKSAISMLHQVVVVASSEVLESAVMDTVDYYFASAYPLLPQPEPYFDLRIFTATELMAEHTRRELKIYLILADLSKDDKGTQLVVDALGEQVLDEEKGVKIAQNRWAHGQMVVYMYAQNEEELALLARNSYPSLAKKISQFYEKQMQASAYIGGSARDMNKLVSDQLNVDMDIPYGYVEFRSDSSLVWMQKYTRKGKENIIVSVTPYESPEQFSRAGIKQGLNEAGRYVVSETPGSRWVINDVSLPLLLTQTEIKGKYAVIAQGVWEMTDDFYGGPYVAYFILDDKNNRIIMLEGFVYAPNQQKRNKMILLEHVLKNIKL